MSRRTMLHYKLDVYREVQRQVDLGQITQAIQDYLAAIDQKAFWTFLIAESELRLEAPYTTGTVTVADNAAGMNGSGTVWDTSWAHKRVKIGAYMEQRVSAFTSFVSADFYNEFSGPTLVSDSGYTIFQSEYLLPSDCEPGRDECIKGPDNWGLDGDGIIPKKNRQWHEHHRYENRTASTPLWYTDAGVDETTNRPMIMFYPYPDQSANVRLVYYRRMPVPANDGAYIMIPDTFERMVIAGASAIVMQRNGMKGWMILDKEASVMLNDLYNRYAASQAYDMTLEPDDGYYGTYSERRTFDANGRLYNP